MAPVRIQDELLDSLLKKVKVSSRSFHVDRIRRAYEFAKKAHEGQFRASGEAYIQHPVEAAKILLDLDMDEESIVAALLHDVPEDTSYDVEDVERRFGKNVARIVDALTKLAKVHYKYSMDERQVLSLQKFFVETADDPRVVIIKLADRLHNMRTLRYLRPDKQQRIAKETLEIFAPLANIYGIYQLRREIEDECFRTLQAEEYLKIKSFVHDHENQRKAFVQKTLATLKRALNKAGIKAELSGRPKHFYSIYQKTVHEEKILQDIYDYFAIRIIVQTQEECYRALGVVHHLYKPKPTRFKDYIALPKPNGYRSLHTTVIGLEGQLTEIQIRTEEMHDAAERGVAAHLLYKDWNGKMAEGLLSLKSDLGAGRFMKNLREDVLKSRILVFSPDGDTVHLPEGATCLDYVYAVDFPVSPRAFRIFVNGQSYALTGELKMGDRVEILHLNREQAGPERWWLSHVKTGKAREKIREFFEKSSFETRLRMGEELLQEALDHENLGAANQLPKRLLARATDYCKAQHFEEVLAGIGSGRFEADEIYHVMFPALEVSWLARVHHFLHGLKKRFRPGEDHFTYRIRIYVEALDRVGLLKELIQPFYDLNIPILRLHSLGHDVRRFGSMAWLYNRKPSEETLRHGPLSRHWFDIYVQEHSELIALFDRLEKVPGMVRVQRLFRAKQWTFFLLSAFTFVYFLGLPFVMDFLRSVAPHSNEIPSTLFMIFGQIWVVILLVWLRTLGNKTFPHFDETRWFWPTSFMIATFAVTSLFLNTNYFHLDLNVTLNIVFSILLFVLLGLLYLQHEIRRRRYLEKIRKLGEQTVEK